jgi:hypothetical protein
LSKTDQPEEDPMAHYPRRRPGTDDYAASRVLFDALITRLGEREMTARPEHAVEEFITGTGRDVLKQKLQDHLDARAAAEPRLAEVPGADQVVRRRAEPGHTRLLATTLGEVEVTRIAYRNPEVSNLHPADARLAMPDGHCSYPLQKAVVHESVTGALRQARDSLARLTGTQVGTQQLMQITIDASQDVRDFYQQHPAPAPAVRAPADILPADASERAARRPGPKAVNRQLDASIVDSTLPMTRRMFDRAEQRDPQHLRRWIVLVDGNNHQIDRIHAEAHTHGVKVNVILDFVHVLQYLWDAAADLHATQPGRAGFVARTARDLLHGHPGRVILDLTGYHDTLTRNGTTAPGLKRCIDYLTAKQPYLIYGIALTMGWPIATGVIEGSCRYLVKDRLAITGARWSLPGAEAVLLLRAVTTNGDLESYWKFHLRQDYQRTHTTRYQHQYDLAA